MHILVTGGAGYIGSVCVEDFLDRGHEVVVVDNLSAGHEEAVDERADFIAGDISDASALEKVLRSHKVDAVVHFAAKALVPESMEHPLDYFFNNTVGVLHLLKAMENVGVRTIVFSSTCAVYGIPSEVPIAEETPIAPINPYGESKAMAERILDWHATLKGFKVIRLRYFNAAGATAAHGEAHDVETHLIPNLFKVALGQREKVTIHGGDYPTPDGSCIRDYIHVRDLAHAHALALDHPESGTFNLGTGEGYSVFQVLEGAREISGHPIPVEIGPRRSGDPPRLVAAAEKARRVLRWTPRHSSLKNILESAWAWHKTHPQGYT